MGEDTHEGIGWREQDTAALSAPGGLRTDVAHPARMYDYYLGGKDNFPADREAAEAVIKAYPDAPDAARANRAFLGRAVRYVAGHLGIRQFLDIGTGIPTRGNTNEVAHAVAPDARVLYVDNDPIVLSHARALLQHADSGRRTSVLLGDLREPEKILAEARDVLDLNQPVALMLIAILHFIRAEDRPQEILRELLAALPRGSALIITHGTFDFAATEGADEAVKGAYRRSTAPGAARNREEVAALFAGTELADPGLVQLPFWRPDGGTAPEGSARVAMYAGVGVTR